MSFGRSFGPDRSTLPAVGTLRSRVPTTCSRRFPGSAAPRAAEAGSTAGARPRAAHRSTCRNGQSEEPAAPLIGATTAFGRSNDMNE